MKEKRINKTLEAIEDLEHYLSESQLYGLNLVQIGSVQEKITNIKKIFIDENRDNQADE